MFSGHAGELIQYDRKIRYLDYIENGKRVKGTGFIKLERRGEQCNIHLQVSGLYRKDHFSRPVMLLGKGEEKELCKLQLADGGIKLYLEGLNSQNIGGQDISYEELSGIRIPISEGKEIRCTWKHQKKIEEENLEVIEDSQEMESENKQKTVQDSEQDQNRDSQWDVKDVKHSTFQDDKWQQLWQIYPHVCPFSDEREYLSLGLSDFVLLNSKSYKLVNNSFLVHGFYQYRHLILMRYGSRNSIRYYIGVPGNLYEREKRTALMYGFEGFECVNEPAKEGDFGYYLTPVEL